MSGNDHDGRGIPTPIPFTPSTATKRERPLRDGEPEVIPLHDAHWGVRAVQWGVKHSGGILRLLTVLLLPGVLVAVAWGAVLLFREWRADQAAWRAEQHEATAQIVGRLGSVEGETKRTREEMATEARETRRVLEAIRDRLPRRF